MSGINISTIDLIDNFFSGKFNKYEKDDYISASAFEISQCGIYLINSLPGYVYCETECDEITEIARLNGYMIDPISKEICQYRNCRRLASNERYPSRIKELIENIITNFFKSEEARKKDKIKIKNFKIIRA